MTDKATHTPLPCPFCGGNKVLISQTLDQKAPNWFAACHRATCAFTGYSSTEAEALTAWNTRAVNSHHELIEALRGLLDEIGKSACADTILDSAAAGKAFAAIAEVEGRRG